MTERHTTHAPQRRLSVEERRQEILDAATEIFSTTPYSEVPTQRIADHCGVSQGLVFHYFDSKAGLYTAFLERTAINLHNAQIAAAEGLEASDTEEIVRRGLDIYLNYIETHPFVWSTGKRGGEEPIEAIHLRIERHDTTVQALCDFLGRSDDRARIAVSGLIGFIDAIALDWVDDGCPAEQRELLINVASAAFLAAL